jgi:hypothetical protein
VGKPPVGVNADRREVEKKYRSSISALQPSSSSDRYRYCVS